MVFQEHPNMIRRFWTALLVITATAVAVPLAQKGAQKTDKAPKSDARLESFKKEAIADVESRQELVQRMVDQIFSYGELGFQEFETVRYLIDILKTNGFSVQEGVAGIPTAFI